MRVLNISPLKGTATSKLTEAMDVARGGKFLTGNPVYPATAWWTYTEATCKYSCQATEYLYAGRVEHSHWSRSVEILCSDWWNLSILAPRGKGSILYALYHNNNDKWLLHGKNQL